jgi:hypothetical protein
LATVSPPHAAEMSRSFAKVAVGGFDGSRCLAYPGQSGCLLIFSLWFDPILAFMTHRRSQLRLLSNSLAEAWEAIVPELFDPAAREIYHAIRAATATFGDVKVEQKKTSVHLVAKSAFAGVHPRKGAVLLNIRSDAEIESPRIRKVEQVSRSRFHNEMLVASPEEVDREVVGWLRRAFNLSAGA